MRFLITILTVLLPYCLFSQIQYDFVINCQSMFAEQRYEAYMKLFDSPSKNGVPPARTRIKKHIAITENVTIYEIGGSTQLTIITSFTQRSDTCYGSMQVKLGKNNVFQTQGYNPSQQGLENFVNRYILKVKREWLIALIMNQNGVYLSMNKERKKIVDEITDKLRENAKLTAKIEKMQIRISENNMSIDELRLEEQRVKELMLDQKKILEAIDEKLKSISINNK